MTYSSLHAKAQTRFDPAPSLTTTATPKFRATSAVPKTATCVCAFITETGKVPTLAPSRAALAAAGFKGKAGEVIAIPSDDGPTFVLVGTGRSDKTDANAIRDAAAAFARATSEHEHLAMHFPEANGAPLAVAQAIAEGVLLGRYCYTPMKQPKDHPALAELTLVSTSAPSSELQRGLERGGITSRAVALARDLANAPGALLTARKLADIAEKLSATTGLEVEIFDEEQLSEMGCGGLLGVNAGSAEPARMIKLTYRPKATSAKSGTVALVAKGIMYDSGGIALKPGDEIHAQMKNDMSGAGAVLSAMTALAELECPHTVIGFLMCTDNMPSGTAMKLGDVLTVRGGKTVEVINTDAEGRLVMSDGLVLATELDPTPDAIVDIATLTGAAMRTLGTLSAAVMTNHPTLLDQLQISADRTDETVWQLPLDHRLRDELDSVVADIKNLGGVNAGSITAGLFLEEFVAGIPWLHIDMCGTAHSATDRTWRAKGMTGYGTRLLIDFLTTFKKPAPAH